MKNVQKVSLSWDKNNNDDEIILIQRQIIENITNIDCNNYKINREQYHHHNSEECIEELVDLYAKNVYV